MEVLACFIIVVKGVKLHDLGLTAAFRGEEVILRRDPTNRYDANCVNVRLKRGRLLLGHLEASMAAVVSPMMNCIPLVIDG